MCQFIFIVPQCPDLGPPPNGYIVSGGSMCSGRQCIMECNTGYEAVGDTVRQCMIAADSSCNSAIWVGQQLECRSRGNLFWEEGVNISFVQFWFDFFPFLSQKYIPLFIRPILDSLNTDAGCGRYPSSYCFSPSVPFLHQGYFYDDTTTLS